MVAREKVVPVKADVPDRVDAPAKADVPDRVGAPAKAVGLDLVAGVLAVDFLVVRVDREAGLDLVASECHPAQSSPLLMLTRMAKSAPRN